MRIIKRCRRHGIILLKPKTNCKRCWDEWIKLTIFLEKRPTSIPREELLLMAIFDDRPKKYNYVKKNNLKYKTR